MSDAQEELRLRDVCIDELMKQLATTEAALATTIEQRDQAEHQAAAAEAALADAERLLRRTVEGVCNARSLQHAQEIANAALKEPT